MRLAAGFIAVAVLAQDPSDTLAKARDKVLLGNAQQSAVVLALR